ncbi:ERF family protein [Afipia sp. DC4300-2b1]|uniref:ERF family protein n=1 Tax=Afipia sp. DC4300-2b1 TaxID=2804672 RepID=UPI003CF3202E
MSNAVAMHEPQVLAAMTPMDMLNKAVSQGANIDVLEKLMSLQERWEANQARKAFDEAMASAKAEIPVIIKNRTVDFTSAKGRTHYRHEDLAEVARTVTPILARHGLSYRFRTSSAVNEPVVVTCIVSHRDGHFEENTLTAGRDDSGNKNNIQAVGSTLTYLQRMTLKAALGLAASDDDDGAASDGSPDTVSDEKLAQLVELAEAVSADKAAFCKYMKIKSLADLPAKDFDRAVAALNKKGAKS